MVFSSLIFLFIFLPTTLLLYFLFGNRFRNSVLLICSLFFYFWGEVHYVMIMIASIAINYSFGMIIERAIYKKLYLIFAISANLLLLGYYKYCSFFIEAVNPLLITLNFPQASVSSPHLPIGISFFTFQSLSYVIDVFRKEVPAQPNPLKLGLYISFFPQLIAGPIVRYQDIAAQLVERTNSIRNFTNGIERFIIGLSKKVLIANVMADIADSIFEIPATALSVQDAWLGIICYTLQIYFDFSGYSDMAIGLAKMFGFNLLENFNYPYIAQSMQDFWRRWHISLSTWFRDYVYIPLGGNAKGITRTYFNLVVVFTLCGLWHGANWTFLAWGLFHGFFLVVERWQLSRLLLSLPRPLRHLYTLLVIVIGWVIFRATTLEEGIAYLSAMFNITTATDLPTHTWLLAKTNDFVWFILLIGIIGSTPLFKLATHLSLTLKEMAITTGRFSHIDVLLYGCKTLFLLSLFMLCVFSLASGTYNPFIYFRF